MPTLVAFHAHPDDECITTAGTLAKAVDDGHRVVSCTPPAASTARFPRGRCAGRDLVERRMDESGSTEAIGVDRVEFLGYGDSGMMGTPENDDPASFWQADVDEAAARLAAILRDERPEVLLVYDVNGNYGHPDHIQVHRVGVRAGERPACPTCSRRR